MHKKILCILVVLTILASGVIYVAFADGVNSSINANPGANINTYCGFEVKLDGSGSEANGVIASYSWRFVSMATGSTAVLSDATSVTAKFVPDVLGEYIIGLTVSDGVNVSEEKTVIVRAKALDADTDDIDLRSVAGPITLNYTFVNAIPLSDGWIITADSSSKVLIVNVLTGQVAKSFQLSASPADMAIDYENGLLLVTMRGASSLAKIDIYGGTVSYINLPSAGSTIEKADAGRVFVCVYTGGSYSGDICVVDYTTNTVVSRLSMGYYDGNLYAFNAKYNYLFVANSGISAATVSRYSYNPQTGTLTRLTSTTDLGSNGQDIRVSPDGEHLIFCAGGGNGSGYTIYDIDPCDFSKRFGEFNNGAYPRSGWFSQDNKYFLGTNYDKIMLFDVATHALLSTFSINSDQGKVYFSRGSKLIYWFNGTIGRAYKTYINDGTPVDIDSLEVLGYDIGFNKNTTDYTVVLPTGTTKVPKINVTANEMFDVMVSYPGTLPGKATVTVGAGGVTKKTYNFSFMEVSRLTVSLPDTYYISTGNLANLNPYVYFNNGTSKSIANTAAYKSSNETAVSVDSTGKLLAKARGYSQITVEAYGVRKSIDVYVDVDVDSITVDGYNIAFTPSKTSYTVVLPAGTISAPTVNAVANAAFNVNVTYPAALPGTATVTVGAGGTVKKTYGIYFDKLKEQAAPVTANIEGGAVDEGTQIILSSATSNANIYYSINGSGYKHYTTPIEIIGETTINAYATRSDMTNSGISAFTYTIKPKLTTNVIVSNTVGQRGRDVDVDVMLENNPGIAAFALSFDFDNTLISPISVTAGDILAGGTFVANTDETQNPELLKMISVSWSKDCNFTSNGMLFKMKFHIKDDVIGGEIPIFIYYIDGNVVNQDYQNVSIVTQNGIVKLKPGLGNGDIFGDGVVSVKDGLKMTQYLAGQNVVFAEDEWSAADVNCDGVVDIKDGLRLAQYLAGWNVKLGE